MNGSNKMDLSVQDAWIGSKIIFGSSKRYSLGNDYNGVDIQFALENIFNIKYEYLDLFLFRINVSSRRKAMKSSKKGMSEKRVMPTKNIGTRSR